MAGRQNQSQIETFWRHCRKYFRDYGGWSAIFTSPFAILAVILGGVSYSSWGDSKWTDLVFQVMPNLLGFSLGTYALLFSLMSNPIKNALKNIKNKNGVLYIDELNATFLHFIFMQILSFLWAYSYSQHIISDVHDYLKNTSVCHWDFMPLLRDFGSFVGISLFLYAFLLTLAASLAVYRIARLSEPD